MSTKRPLPPAIAGDAPDAGAPPALEVSSTPLLLGDWLLEPRELRLRRDGEQRRLEPRMLQVLLALARRNGGTVTRDELLAEAWAGQVVSDDAIQRAVAKLRAVLATDGDPAPVIETVPRIGYRLCLPVAWPPASASEPARAAPGGAAAPPLRAVSPWRRALLLGLLLVLGLALHLGWRERPASAPVAAPDGAPAAGSAAAPVTPRWRPFTGQPGLNTAPSFAPDGSAVVFSAGTLGEERLWIKHMASGELRQLTFEPGSHLNPVWTRNGRIVYVVINDNRCSFRWVAEEGGDEQRFAECGARALPRPDVSPDGRQLVVSDMPPGLDAWRLLIVDIDSGQQRVLLGPPYGAIDRVPRWSTDGAWILYSRHTGAVARQIRRVRPSGADDQLLAEVPMRALDLLTLPDGRWLAAVSDHASAQLLLGADDGEPALLATLKPGTIEMALAPDGATLAVATTTVENSAYQLDLRDGTSQPMPAFLQKAVWAALSADGRQAAFVRRVEMDRSAALWLGQLGSGETRLLWHRPGIQASNPAFSRDGRRVAFVQRLADGQQVCQIEIAPGSTEQCVPRSGGRDLAPAFAHDGRLLFTSNRGGMWRQWIAELDGSAAMPIELSESAVAQDSADGRFRYLRDVRTNELIQVTLSDGSRRVLGEDTNDLGSQPLMPLPDGVLYLSKDNQLRRVDARSGAARTIASLPYLPFMMGVTADGKTLGYLTNDRQTGDILLLENIDALIRAASPAAR